MKYFDFEDIKQSIAAAEDISDSLKFWSLRGILHHLQQAEAFHKSLGLLGDYEDDNGFTSEGSQETLDRINPIIQSLKKSLDSLVMKDT